MSSPRSRTPKKAAEATRSRLQRLQRMHFKPRFELLEDRTLMNAGHISQQILLTPISDNAVPAEHIHAHLSIIVDGQKIGIPADIGTDLPLPTLAASDVGNALGALPMHTHDATGTIHIESPILADFQVQDFFTVWGKAFTSHNIAGFSTDAAHPIQMTVNGKSHSELGTYVIQDQDVIEIRATTPASQLPPGKANELAIRQLYHDLLQRDVDAPALSHWMNLMNLGATTQQVASAIRQSFEYAGKHPDAVLDTIATNGGHSGSAQTPSEFAVAQLYQDLLQRSVDATGLAAWSAALDKGMTRQEVAQAIASSSEHHMLELQGMYLQFLHRPIDDIGAQNFGAALSAGQTIQQVAATIAGSKEYLSNRGDGTTAGFLAAVYQDSLNRALDGSGAASFEKAIGDGSSRSAVAGVIFNSDEFRQNQIQNYYVNFLNRPADLAGLSAMIGAMKQGTTVEQVVASILASDEKFSELQGFLFDSGVAAVAPKPVPSAGKPIETFPTGTIATAQNGGSAQSSPGIAINTETLPIADPNAPHQEPLHPLGIGPKGRGILDTLSPEEKQKLADATRDKLIAAGLVGTGQDLGQPTGGKGGDGDGMLTPGASKNFNGIAENGWTPSDMGLAVGSSQVLQAVNQEIAVYSKTGVLQLGWPKTLQTFFGLSASTFTTDPRALYDWYGKRFIVIMIHLDSGSGHWFTDIAASQTNSATGSWWIYHIDYGTNVPDYPTLGQDRQGIYIGSNFFNGAGAYLGNQVTNYRKSDLYSGAGVFFWWWSGLNVGGTQVDTIQPANVQNPNENPRAEFLVNSFNINFGGGQCINGCSGLVLWAWSNPFGWVTGGPNPRLTGIVVGTNSYFESFGAHEPGASYSIETIDTRISGSVVYSAGRLYASASTRVSHSPLDETSPYWWEITGTLNDGDSACTGSYAGKCAQITNAYVLQQDCYFCGGWASDGSAFFATLQPDTEDNVNMVFNYSSDTFFPGTAYVSRRVTQALNTMHDSGIFLQTGLAFYNQGRWGDYTGTAIDLGTAGQPYFWFSGMYVRSDGLWGTKIGKNGFTSTGSV